MTFLCYCVLLDCESLRHVDFIPLFIIHVWHRRFLWMEKRSTWLDLTEQSPDGRKQTRYERGSDNVRQTCLVTHAGIEKHTSSRDVWSFLVGLAVSCLGQSRRGRTRESPFNSFPSKQSWSSRLCLLNHSPLLFWYTEMCAILRVVAYFSIVNILHMYTVFVLYVWHPHFPLME